MEEIREKLREIILGIFEVEVEPEVTVAPEGMPADFASNVAMKLAGMLHSAPMEIAGKIKEKIEEDGGAGFLVEVARPGFLNFRMKDEFFIEKLREMRENFAEAMRIDKHKGELVICEFSDPNPFKVLHVGHLFTTVIGDAVARLYERAGAKVVRANFGGDIGMHVAKTMFILQKKRMDRRMSATEVVEMIAKCYVEGTRAYEDNVFSKMEITAINKFLYQVVEAGEDAEWERDIKIQTDEGEVEIQGRRVAERYWWGRKASYEYFGEFYKILGVKFDKYYPESSVMKRGVAEVEKGLSNGVFTESNGAVVFPGEEYGLHTRVFINREGLPTYEAKDFGLGLTKWEDYKFDENVVITGNDIIEYMKVIFKAEELVEPEVAKRSRHIAHGNLKLLGGVKMSSRKGNFVTAEEVIEAVQGELRRETGSEDMRVVMAAIKFAFLKNKLEGNTNFDIHSSVRMSGASGTYLQYATVRANKIIAGISSGGEVAEELDENERKLVKKLYEYRGVLEEAILELAPHKVCGYLYELAQEFSRFYEKCKVVGDEREGVRGEIVEVYYRVMVDGLEVLGIEVPNEM